MQTIVTILLLIIFSVVIGFLGVFILNFAGLPGTLLAGKPGIRSKSQFRIGSIISSIGQTYIYLAYTAFIVSWTMNRIIEHDAVKFVAWIFAFLAVIIPLYKDLIRARVENKEAAYANPQIEALHLTFLLVFVGFFIFVFVPNVMNILWNWVPYVISQ
jgi:hypothetical protein